LRFSKAEPGGTGPLPTPPPISGYFVGGGVAERAGTASAQADKNVGLIDR